MPDRRPEDTSPTAPVTPPLETPESASPEPPPQRTSQGRTGASASDKAESNKAESNKAGSNKAGSDKQAKGNRGERFAAVLAATTGTGQAKGSETGKGSADAPGVRGLVQKASASGVTNSVTQKRVRRARLRLTHVDPLSVMKTSFLLSVAIGIVTVVAVAIVWALLGAAGLWDSIDSAITDVLGDSSDGFRIEDYLGTGRVLGFTMIVAVVDVILITVIATLAAFLYNLAAALLGGVEVVLAEEDR